MPGARKCTSMRELEPTLAPCFAEDAPKSPGAGYLADKLPALEDPEGARIPAGLPAVLDAHVHVFPERLFAAIWRWFDDYGWPIRYRLGATQVIEFLRARGVDEMVLLTYAHKPGIARTLNAFVAELGKGQPNIIGCGTVFPGEPGSEQIVREAFDAGLSGIKLHCHVQCTPVDAPELEAIYRECQARGLPVIVHAGREPKSPAYRCDTHAVCAAERCAAVLRAFPQLQLVVPHLGADEFSAYEKLMSQHDNLWLDTTMIVAGYFPITVPWRLVEGFPGRVMYGTDFPNLPYAWDRELGQLLERKLTPDALELLLGGAARRLFRRGETETKAQA